MGGGGEPAGGVARDFVVPARPGEAGARHDRGVGVHGGDVGLVVECAAGRSRFVSAWR